MCAAITVAMPILNSIAIGVTNTRVATEQRARCHPPVKNDARTVAFAADAVEHGFA
jgi:hypothetical protein